MSGKVESVLVTGEQGPIMDFWMPFCGVLNTIDGRDRTTRFTVWNDPPVMDGLVESARRAGVGLQRIIGAGDAESYETLHDAGVGLWGASQETAGADDA